MKGKFTFLLNQSGLIYIFVIFLALPNAPSWSSEKEPPLPLAPFRGKLDVPEMTKILLEASRQAFKPNPKRYSGEPLTIQECLDRALKVHGPALIAKEEFRLAQLRHKEALRNLFPTASIEAEAIQGSTPGEDFRGRGVDLKLQQPLWDGKKKWKLFKQSKLNLEIAKRNYEKILTDLDAETRRSYVILMSAQENWKKRQELVESTEKIYEATRERWNRNLIRKVEFLAVSNQFDEIKYQAQAAEREWVLAELALRQLLRQYEETPLRVAQELKIPDLEISLEKCLSLAYQNRPDFQLSKLAVDLQRTGREIAQSETGFQLNADASLGVRAEAFDSEDLDYKEEYFLGLSGSIPLLDHVLESNTLVQDTVPSAGQTTSTEFQSQTLRLNLFSNTGPSRRLEAAIRYHRACEELEKAKRNLLFQVGQAYFECHRAWEQIQNALGRQKLEGKESELVSIQVSLNEVPLSDLMSSLSQKTGSQIEVHSAMAAYYSALSELNKGVGGRGIFSPEESLK